MEKRAGVDLATECKETRMNIEKFCFYFRLVIGWENFTQSMN